jgi:YidC/Oxa1 family membrane protein insertase
MDRNRLIGLILISSILIFYTHFWGPKNQPIAKHDKDSGRVEAKPSGTGKTLAEAAMAQYGIFAQSVQQDTLEKEAVLENKDIKITFSSLGGTIKEVILKNYLDSQGNPLLLLDAASSQMGFEFTSHGVTVNTHQLSFNIVDEEAPIQSAEVGRLSFTCMLSPSQYIRQVYTLPKEGYQVTCDWDMVGLQDLIDGNHVGFVWYDAIKRAEKDLQACRNKSTVNYYLANQSFKHLKERSNKQEIEDIAKPIQWVGIKQRFFTAGIIAEKAFAKGRISLNPTLGSESTVKEAQLWLTLPEVSDLTSRQGKFQFYFGPNEYKTLQKVAPGFSKNLSLGWPVVKWINQFLIFPIFSLLKQYMSNYGVIIICLVVLIKLLLLPLSYKSYISMAEMKVLKPDLDKIKAQHGNDLQKIQFEQAKLYKEMGMNPLSGCIPVLLQMPILLAMFNFFPNAIEFRQKGFLWAPDLSTYDAAIQLPFTIPIYGNHISLFTLLMTASTILYTWSNNQVNAPQGPMKAMSYLLPITFMLVLNSFPAGLSLYYFVSNLITFGQQSLIKRFVNEDQIKEKLANHKKKSKQNQPGRFKARLQSAIRRSSAKQ